MNIHEFQKMVQLSKWKEFSYLSENQEGYCGGDCLEFNCTYQQIIIVNVPNIIALKNGQSTLSISQVKSITVEPILPNVDVIRISCLTPFGGKTVSILATR